MKKIPRTVKLVLFHLFIITAIVLACFKYSEEILNLKSKIYYLVQSPHADANIDFTDYPPITRTGAEWYWSTPLIYHAGGGIDGLDYTNSKEALEASISNGHFFVEIDFAYTADSHLVCMHKWDEQWNSAEPPTLEEFTSTKIFDKYSPMTADEVIQYMEKYPELHVIIDTKENDVVNVISDLIQHSSYDTSITDRFIIQLYTDGMKEQINKLYPFKDENFLFTVYKFGHTYPNKIMKLCYDENISVITVPYAVWSKEIKDLFTSKGFILYEHTVNRPDYANDSLAQGVHGFYTDFLSAEDIHVSQ